MKQKLDLFYLTCISIHLEFYQFKEISKLTEMFICSNVITTTYTHSVIQGIIHYEKCIILY